MLGVYYVNPAGRLSAEWCFFGHWGRPCFHLLQDLSDHCSLCLQETLNTAVQLPMSVKSQNGGASPVRHVALWNASKWGCWKKVRRGANVFWPKNKYKTFAQGQIALQGEGGVIEGLEFCVAQQHSGTQFCVQVKFSFRFEQKCWSGQNNVLSAMISPPFSCSH